MNPNEFYHPNSVVPSDNINNIGISTSEEHKNPRKPAFKSFASSPHLVPLNESPKTKPLGFQSQKKLLTEFIEAGVASPKALVNLQQHRFVDATAAAKNIAFMFEPQTQTAGTKSTVSSEIIPRESSNDFDCDTKTDSSKIKFLDGDSASTANVESPVGPEFIENPEHPVFVGSKPVPARPDTKKESSSDDSDWDEGNPTVSYANNVTFNVITGGKRNSVNSVMPPPTVKPLTIVAKPKSNFKGKHMIAFIGEPSLGEICDKLMCTNCDFEVTFLEGRYWDKRCEYLFFRKYMPDKHKLIVQSVLSPKYYAYCCQCSWRSVKGRESVAAIMNQHEATLEPSSRRGDELRWSCLGH
jgi:hypothetical protein